MAGVKSLDELRAWQLALKFKRAVYALIDAGVFATDFKLEGQLREASRSAASQIAEGDARAMLTNRALSPGLNFSITSNPQRPRKMRSV
jgi:four helix bundle protein